MLRVIANDLLAWLGSQTGRSVRERCLKCLSRLDGDRIPFASPRREVLAEHVRKRRCDRSGMSNRFQTTRRMLERARAESPVISDDHAVLDEATQFFLERPRGCELLDQVT